jgi:hypothetical protein
MEKGERGKTVPLEALANLLIEKGHLTRHQADALVVASKEPDREADLELGLAPIADEPSWSSSVAPARDRLEPALAETRADSDDFAEAQSAALLKPIDAQPKRAGGKAGESATTGTRWQMDDGLLASELPVERLEVPGVPSSPSKRRNARSEWDSPLMLIGGGSLLLLLLVGGLVWYLVQTDTGNAQLEAARQAYDDGAYSQAIQEYEQFLDKHAGHDEASGARVHLGLARVRRTLDSGAAPEDVLAQLQQVIAEIESEPAFGDAGRELAAILPEIAEGLAEKANQAESSDVAAALTTKTEDALALVTNTKYVPKSFRPVERIDRVRNTLASVQRRGERQKDLASALGDIAAAVQKKAYQDAYGAHQRLVEKHPEAAELDEVLAAAKQIAAAEAASIEFREQRRAATTEERSDPGVETVILATTTQEGAGAGEVAIVFLRIEGALYGIDAASGEFLWRRYVGIAPHLPPVATPDGDVLVIDVEHGETLRLAGRTGSLVWRQEIGAVVAHLALWSNTALIPTADARLAFVDVATGETRGFIQFAQPLAAPPFIDEQSGRIFVVGEHSIVYVLAPDGRRGESAIFVGHEPGMVSVPVVGYGRTLCVIENFAVERARMHVFSATAISSNDPENESDENEGGSPEPAWQSRIEPIRLTGRVTTPIALAGRRFAVATDRGEIRVFDVSIVEEGPPLAPIVSRDASGQIGIDRHLFLDDSSLWVADTRLSRLKVVAAGGRLQAQDLANVYNGDTFTHPLASAGENIIHVRRPHGDAGYFVAATNLRSGDPVWEGEVAAPPADLSVLPEAKGIALSLVNGRAIELTAAPTPDAATREQARSHMLAQNGVYAIDHSGEWAIATRVTPNFEQGAPAAADEVFLLAMNKTSVAPRSLALSGSLAARPRAFAEGLLVPLRIGQVLLLDPDDGTSLAAPFQPPIDPARLPEWTAPASVVPGESFAIADRYGIVYLVHFQRNPHRLALAHQSEPLESSIVGELCVTASTLIAVTANRRLIALRLPELVRANAVDVSEEVVWGPFAATDCVLFATADDRLLCVADDGSAIAETSLSTRPVGRPLPQANSMITIALGDGTLMSVDTAKGSISPIGNVGQPLALGPVPWGGRLFAATPDGVLVSVPETPPAEVTSAVVSN